MAVRADLRRLRQILLTLLTNAARFTKHGHLRVQAELGEPVPEGSRPDVRLVVADTGPGIPKADLKSLFSPFGAGSPGTALGLSISHELARLMNGELTVESTEGRGTAIHPSLAGRGR